MVFTPPLSLFLTITTPLVQISFSSQPSATIKIKVGGHNCFSENIDYSLAKIMPALQVTEKLVRHKHWYQTINNTKQKAKTHFLDSPIRKFKFLGLHNYK